MTCLGALRGIAATSWVGPCNYRHGHHHFLLVQRVQSTFIGQRLLSHCYRALGSFESEVMKESTERRWSGGTVLSGKGAIIGIHTKHCTAAPLRQKGKAIHGHTTTHLESVCSCQDPLARARSVRPPCRSQPLRRQCAHLELLVVLAQRARLPGAAHVGRSSSISPEQVGKAEDSR